LNMILKYTLAWCPMIVIAIANGIVRQFVYGPQMSELSAHQISSVTGIALFFLYTIGLGRLMPLQNGRQAFLVGGIWLILTVAFEFFFGLLIVGHPLEKLLYDYNIAAGRLWGVVLISLVFMPYLAYRILLEGSRSMKDTRRDGM